MRPLDRALTAALVIGLWLGGLTPWVLEVLDGQRAGRASPQGPGDVRKRLSLLPSDAGETPAVARLHAALARDEELMRIESDWNRAVAGLLTDPQRAQAVALADLRSPTPPPPFEAPEADGDVVAVARAIIERYGYDEREPPKTPAKDRWPGADRRTRARGLVALVRGPGLEAEVAHNLLAVTLSFLDAQLQRADNMAMIQTLLPVAMGEAPDTLGPYQ